MSRRSLSLASAFALLVAPAFVGATPARAVEYGGFATSATASPLKFEMFEPAIPVPAKPEIELNFSFTRVAGETGPAARARASAMWPGAAVGEGLPLFGDTLGLPPELTQDGYPVQVNAAYPSDATQQAAEPFPGMVQRVDAGKSRTTAKAGYTPSGDLSQDEAEPDPLDSILEGDLTAIGDILTGPPKSGNDENPVSPSPLGNLSLLVDVDGMTSVSSTENDGETASAQAVSRLGEIRLLGGLITLGGVSVTNQVSSALGKETAVRRTVDVGNMTIAGQKFGFGPDGFTGGGSTTPIPGLPKDPEKLLATLGIALELPRPTVTRTETGATVEAEALRITIDLKPLRSNLPLLPLDDLVANLPDLPGQANLLKGMILSLNTIAPRVVLRTGYSIVSASTVKPVDLGGGTPTGPVAGGPVPGTGVTGGGAVPGALPPAELPPVDSGPLPVLTPPIAPTAAAPGIPALGTIPTLLVVAAFAMAGAAGWYLRTAGVALMSGGAACSHGLRAGLPDLRKA
ncbi:MAG TPA: choice-of-anchor P family protein [Nocardioidaceae bacterium]|nr:choice-of-anchor P family protein [Nocardioidaceae bacterium]